MRPRTVPGVLLYRTGMTGEQHIAWFSIVLLNLGWFCEVYIGLLHSVALSFVARGFTADTRLIALVSTIILLFRGSIGPLVNYASDRLWTPIGRRRPFVIGAYALSAFGLIAIPLMHSLTGLIVAVTCQAFFFSFASPWEPLYMELIPQPQQGRSQAIRNVFVQFSVLYFFQISLAQLDLSYGNIGWGPHVMSSITGVHLAFWLGGAVLLMMALLLAVCTRERRPPGRIGLITTRDPHRGTVRTFVRNVFGDKRWWPAYALYIVPNVILGIWGNFQSLMLVEQFGFDMTSMARVGLPVSLLGMAVTGPLLGYWADREAPRGPWPFLVVGSVFAGVAATALRAITHSVGHLPSLGVSLLFCVPLGIACVCLILGAALILGTKFPHLSVRARLIIVSLSGEAALAFIAWCWTHSPSRAIQTMPVSVWLTYTTTAQALNLACTIVLMPLLFSKIPRSNYGTVSSGFGIFGAAVTYLLANTAGAWVHVWTRWHVGGVNQYTSLWLLQAVVACVALVVAWRCMHSRLFTGNLEGVETCT